MSGKDLSEIAKNWAALIAVIGAAAWACYVFYLKEMPGFEVRGGVSTESSVLKTSNPDIIELSFAVTMENKGSTSFDIAKIHVQAWEFDSPQLADRFTFLDIEATKGTKPFHDKTYDLTSRPQVFPSHYPAGNNFTNNFAFFLLKPDCTKWVHFAADFYEPGEAKPTWSSGAWGSECETAELRKADEPSSPLTPKRK